METPYATYSAPPPPPSTPRRKERYWLHVALFLLTLASTVWTWPNWAGRFLYYAQVGEWGFWADGLRFGGALLGFLTVHEFGHYLTARRWGIDVSLPYYIPFPFNGIGTFGAVIRIREAVPSLRKLFDVGAAGPLAGFVVALGVLLYALATLPSPDYIFGFDGHVLLKRYVEQYGGYPPTMLPEPGVQGGAIVLGDTPLFWLLRQGFSDVPPLWELYHYPLLFAGWLGLFFTALNLLPVGQLDGGHVLYALVGPRWHRRLAHGFVLVLMLSASIGFVDAMPPALAAWYPGGAVLTWPLLSAVLYIFLRRIFDGDHRAIAPALLGLVAVTALAGVVGGPLADFGYTGWFVFLALIVFLVRVEHPPVLYHEPLTPGRRVLGILCMIIFVLCFSIKPLYVI